MLITSHLTWLLLSQHKLHLQPQKLVEKFCLYLTLITNLFICSGVIRHWNSMKTQDPEILRLQKQVDKLLEEYRQEEYKKKEDPVGDPSY